MWLLPSRRRPELLKKFVIQSKVTEVSTPCRILIGMKDYFDNQKAYQEIEALLPAHWQIIQTEEVEFGTKVREAWPLVDKLSWVGLLNDDFFPITPKWDSILVSKLTGKNFVSSNDRWMSPTKAATATAFSMPLVNEVGFLFVPGTRHLFIDDFWEQLGRATGCWRICMDVIVEHHHQLRGFGPQGGDTTHQRIYNDMNFLAEKSVFDAWMNSSFNQTVERLRKFQDHQSNDTYTGQVPRPGTPTPMPMVK